MENSRLDYQVPYSLESEQAVLGSILIDPKKLPVVQSQLTDQDFYKRSHQLIFHAMDAISNRENGVIDYVTVVNQLESYDELENAGGPDYLAELIDMTPSSHLAEQYAGIVKEKSTLRQLIAASQKIIEDAHNDNNELSAILDESQKMILSIGEASSSTRFQEMRYLIDEAVELVHERSKQKGDVTGVPTGYTELDKITSGFQPDQLIVLAARPSVGKTAFALNIAQNVATKSKLPVALFSLEMGAIDLVNRIICAEGSIHASNLRTGQLTADEWQSFFVAVDRLKEASIFIDDTAGLKVSEIRAKCRRLKQEHPDLSLIVIDYLQLIEGTGHESRQQQVSDISRQLKMLAKELNTPVIALSQLSRSLEQRQNKRPILSDIRESGSIEQDADIVAFLYREDYHQKDEEDSSVSDNDEMSDNTIEVIIAKNRSGPRDTVRLLFKREYNKFSNLSYQPEPPVF
ncbi:replicative DNA helicase [Dolosicoccus paucivorans]|uniref:replicative DNA helicase n=1 Tax=Dolosicoccus paucivorans TaxID=84521 RepID=UPI0008837DD6|nr:replicative DNA helicase [Dolosicoccus paucivorans]SDI39003.1 primary replicative DNA helicase [Dolosicoccus paucivorans]